MSDGQMHANHMVSGLLPERLALPFPLGDRGAKPRQHDFKLTHRAAQLGQHGVEITYRASGPDVDDIGHQAGSGRSGQRHGLIPTTVMIKAGVSGAHLTRWAPRPRRTSYVVSPAPMCSTPRTDWMRAERRLLDKQRGAWSKLLRRGNFTSKQHLQQRIESFIAYFNATMAKPFRWTMKGKPLVA
jgi:hypothetical protein